MFDSKLDWKDHKLQLKSKCNKAQNLMRSVSSTEWGADQKTLMMYYRSLIRYKVDYGCKVYNSASSWELVSLETVSNEAMRISSGCFKSRPLSSLQVITKEPPLQIRRDELSLNTTIKWKAYYKIRFSNSSLQNNKPYMRIKFLTLRSQSESKKYIQNWTWISHILY